MVLAGNLIPYATRRYLSRTEKTAQKRPQKNECNSAEKGGSSVVRSLPKTHVGYWRTRVERRTYSYDGGTVEVPEYSARMEFGGIRRRLTLGTAIREEAVIKARDIYLLLVAGWDATMAELSPKTVAYGLRKDTGPTVGQFLAEVERTSNLKPKTFRRYAQYFRMLAAQIHGIESDASRHDYRNGGLTLWREQVDAVPLSALTP